MEAPKCRLCGERHYAHEPHAFSGAQGVTKQTAQPAVTPPLRVTKSVTSTPCPDCKRWRSEVEALQAEVKELKRLLATSKPMTGAERVRKHRAAKRKAR